MDTKAEKSEMRAISLPAFRLKLENFALLFVLLGLGVLFSLVSPYFLSWRNILNILLSVSVIGVMAAVSTLVIVGRNLDLSLGSMTALLGVAAGVLIEQFGWSWYAGVVATLALGAVCGALNGAVVAWLRIDSIITTIGTLSVFRGIAYMITDGQTLLIQNEQLLFLGSGRILGIPFSVWLLAAVIAVTHFIAQRTRVGRAVFAIGANPQAALVAGLSVSTIRFWLMSASGVSAGLAALLLVGQSGAATPSAAIGYELLVITAILLGGTSLAGGRGSVLRTALGVMIIGVLNNGMVLMSVPTFYQISAHGLLMLAAVILDRLRSNRSVVLE
jgi:ribose/xylose/arabinose/galactoside ABC-type transport system permease subunit